MPSALIIQNFHPGVLRPDMYCFAAVPNGSYIPLTDASAFSSWTDLSGNGNTQTSSGVNRPVYDLAGVNGRPAIRFVSANSNYMSTPSNANNEYAGAVTAFAAFKNDASGSQRLLTKLLTWSMSFLNANYMFTTWNSGGSGVSGNGTGNPIDANTVQANIQMWDGSPTLSFFKNAQVNQSVVLNNTTVVTTNPIYVGSRDGTTNFFNGSVVMLGYKKGTLSSWQSYRLGLYMKTAIGV